MAIMSDHDVIGLQIAMHDTSGVSFCEAFSYVLEVSQQLPDYGRLAMDLLAQGNAIDDLQGDEVRAVVFTDFENLRDVWMTEGRGRL